MRKNKKNNKKKLSTYKKASPFLLLIATLFMGIGYAKISDINLLVSGTATTSEHEGIIITEVNLLENQGTGTGSVVNFSDTLLTTNITLEETNNSTVTFEISIGNNATDGLTHYFTGVTPNGYDPDFYPNKYITYELNGLAIGDALAYKDEVTFTITFKYINNVDFSAYDFTNTLKSYLEFNFDGVSMDKSGAYEYVVPKTGTYQLEVWGASGYSYSEEYHGGYGGYSTGEIYLEKGTTLYIYTGGQGVGGNEVGTYPGGFNGGGNGVLDSNSKYTGSGGGATHIAIVTGELYELENNIDDILIVAGGGGSVYHENNYLYLGGHGGGIEGTGGIQISNEILNGPHNRLSGGGTQNAGGTAGREGAAGSFGQGGEKDALSIGAGGGFYGGGSAWAASAGGGSGYIGNVNLTNKHMIVYSETPETDAAYTPAVTSDATETATNAVTLYNAAAISDVAKSGNGFAKILYLDGNQNGDEIVVEDTVTIFGIEHTVIDAKPTLTTSSNNSNDASGLYASTDTNTGIPTYYFRGNVTNNYVTFANNTWRIVRVNEDGTIRLILNTGINNNAATQYYNSNESYLYTYYSNTGAYAKNTVDTWYANNIGNNANYANKVVTGNYFCEAAKVKNIGFTNGGNANMLEYNQYTPNFKCPEDDGNGKGFVNSNVGLISYDEVAFAGGRVDAANNEYYLYNGSYIWTISPGGISDTNLAQTWRIENNGSLISGRVTYTRTFRAVINLKPDVTITGGNGTADNPFVIQ